MDIQENVSLAAYSTMRLGGAARYLAEVKNEQSLQQLISWAQSGSLPMIMVGRGSNIVWRDEGFNGLVLVNRIMGRDVLAEDDHALSVKVGAGENWDKLVEWTVKKKLTGIEYMSLIPGTAGAAPVQNIGAYGGELAYSLLELTAYDTKFNSFITLQNHECGFSYRSSRFKTTDKGRFFITSITLNLRKSNPAPPFYEALQAYLDQHDIHKYTPEVVRKAVMDIRQSKLPDPEKISNNGSFFTNPIIDTANYQRLQQTYPDIKAWPTSDGRVKVAAGWLVEKAGFKGVSDQQTGMATWPNQALVLVNQNAQHTADLLAFKQKIVSQVQQLFGITLEQEPELLP
ncbi:MAG TPA: UDP-N-acetylmuramate dehydrogenase [Candidatus Saccharimonadales bacterium]|nr:UDP-N-acetylmuramate dehydrogenase [Candidatus Saccharimonadales bacterium]